MDKYSIILPVKNGGNHIKECIESILGQTNSDFNLLILENKSTDNTLEIIADFKDPRITVIPSNKPLSIEENWARITKIAKNEFITLIGHDDVLDANYLAIMHQLIQQYPNASLYQTHFRYIDGNGAEIKKCRPMPETLMPEQVVANFMQDKISLMGTGFMMRGTDYDKVGGIPPYPKLLFADMQLFISLALLGYMATSPFEVFSYRIHAEATTSVSTDKAFIESFDQLVSYFASIKNISPQIDDAVAASAPFLLEKYGQGISHKILKTPKSKRETPSVSEIIEQFRKYGLALTGNSRFDPLSYKKIKLGKTIDNNVLYHSLFLLFKRFFKKPVLS